MGQSVSLKVTPQGVWVPRALVPGGDEVQEVEIEQRADVLIIKPRLHDTGGLRAEIVRDMKAAGLIEDLTWARPPVVSAEERARLAMKLGQGQPLSEVIIGERDVPFAYLSPYDH